MTRQEAINHIKDMVLFSEDREALETLIPELTESGDERIRKAIIGLITELQRSDKYFADVELTDMIAYLEKQEQKQAEWDELQADFRNINEAFEDGKKEVIAHPEKYGLCKSTEWSDEDKTIIEGACNALEVYGHTKLANKLKSLQPQPHSWSKEDRNMLDTIISELEQEGENVNVPDLYRLEINWLKSLRTQPKQEWSEEVEKDVAHIIRVLDDCYAYGKHDLSKTDHENLVNTLKSLQPSWKPNEEQMEALAYAGKVLAPRATKAYEELESLREQLKKLMQI